MVDCRLEVDNLFFSTCFMYFLLPDLCLSCISMFTQPLHTESHPSKLSSISLKFLKKEPKMDNPCDKSAIPITSLQLCIDSCGIPKSTVLIPVFELIMGPIVVPQGQSDLTTNSCIGVFAFRPISLAMKPVTPLVASNEIERTVKIIQNHSEQKSSTQLHRVSKTGLTSLILVRFEDYTSIHLRPMRFLML